MKKNLILMLLITAFSSAYAQQYQPGTKNGKHIVYDREALARGGTIRAVDGKSYKSKKAAERAANKMNKKKKGGFKAEGDCGDLRSGPDC